MKTRRRTFKQVAYVNGFRSGLEEKVAANLHANGVKDADYEKHTLSYIKPEKPGRYTPDFVLPNGIIIETKGRFVTADRQKHKLIKHQHPDLDIRFVFSNSKARIGKKSKTTYAMWCEKNGFQFTDKLPDPRWLKEPAYPRRYFAMQNAFGIADLATKAKLI